ncbi:MAG: hypothetical protein QXU32_02475 [Nitrososphaerales archaeon]
MSKKEPKIHYGEFHAELLPSGMIGSATSKPEQEQEIKEKDDDMVTCLPEWPISIVIIGAPDTGKNKVADAYIELSSDWYNSNNQRLKKIHNSGSKIESEFNAKLGPYGTYRDDVLCFYLGYMEELICRQQKDNFIKVGSVLENMAHCSANLDALSIDRIQTPDTNVEINKYQSSLAHLTYLFMDYFQYHFAFYIPHSSRIIVPGADQSYDTYAQRVDMALRNIFAYFGLSFQVLDGTVEFKAQTIHDTITKVFQEGVLVPKHVADNLGLQYQ